MPNDKKVEFTPEQQEHLDALIGKKFSTLKNENAEYRAEVETLKAELDALQKSSSGSQVDAERLKADLKAVGAERKTLAIMTALTRHDIVDLDAAAKLLSDKVYLDDEGRAVGLGPDDKARLDKSGAIMGLDAYVADFLREHQFLVKAPPLRGAGSFGAGPAMGGGSGSMKRSDFDKLSTFDKSRFTRGGGKLTD